MISSLPPEKLAQLRQIIHGHVSHSKIQEQIRGCLADAIAQEGDKPLDERTLLQMLEDKGLINQVMKTVALSSGMTTPISLPPPPASIPPHAHVSPTHSLLKAPPSHLQATPLHPQAPPLTHGPSTVQPPCLPSHTWPPHPPPPTPSPPTSHSNKRCLFLQVIGGRAFLDHLSDPSHCCHANFTLHLLFRGQRYFSSDVSCACEPDFKQEGFLLELDKHLSGNAGRLISPEDALSISEVIQLVLTRTNHRGEVDLVGTCILEWRKILCEDSGQLSLSLELSGVGTEAKISPGILDIQLDLVPRFRESVPLQLLVAQEEVERQRVAEKERLFLVYAKQWWKEYLGLRPDHAHRLVKIFAPDEVGVSRAVCHFVNPLRAGRLLDSPRHAARFVSLVPLEKVGSVGNSGCGFDNWNSCFSMLASRKGSCEDHACLLCSLLLGFGVEAWVCVGTKVKDLAHAWVMTQSQNGGVVFWESITGQRYVQPTFDPSIQAGNSPPSLNHPYRTVGCVFNHQSFYANCQPTDSVFTVNFDLHNSALWKALSPEAIRCVCGRHGRKCAPPILPPTYDPSLAANEIEEQLRTLTSQHREDLGLDTVWDDDLCYLLSPALSSYETERCVGVAGVGNEEFQDAVRTVVPDGHTFKGFPLQVPHRNPRKLFHTCLQSTTCAEILGCRGDQVNLAVRVKVYAYPESVCAVWVMFAVKYHSIL